MCMLHKYSFPWLHILWPYRRGVLSLTFNDMVVFLIFVWIARWEKSAKSDCWISVVLSLEWSYCLFIPACIALSLQPVAAWLLFLHPPWEATETKGGFHDGNCQQSSLPETRYVIFSGLSCRVVWRAKHRCVQYQTTAKPLYVKSCHTLVGCSLTVEVTLKGLWYSE